MSSDDNGPQKNTETHWQEKYFAVVYVLDCELWKWYNEFNIQIFELWMKHKPNIITICMEISMYSRGRHFT